MQRELSNLFPLFYHRWMRKIDNAGTCVQYRKFCAANIHGNHGKISFYLMTQCHRARIRIQHSFAKELQELIGGRYKGKSRFGEAQPSRRAFPKLVT